MKLSLTINICVRDGMTNGTQGILREFVYNNPAELVENTCNDNSRSIIIDKPPKYIVIELLNHTSGIYDNLPSNYVPVYPVKLKCKYTHKIEDGSSITRDFQRTQLPVTPAFAFTEFKCQGATLEKAIVDLNDGNIKSGVYVMLSRVQKLQDLMILRPFNRSKLDTTVETDLKEELEWLEKCFIKTKLLNKWPSI